MMKKIVVIGGGTGNFVVLRGLKRYDLSLSAVVSMADDGGSTGILRDELGVLPPGDVRQCLVALSSSSLMRDLMNYRFDHGGLGGHSFGNLFLSSLEKLTGSFEKAIQEIGKILSIKGEVIPVTTHQVRLKMVLNNQTVLDGEREIYLSTLIDQGYRALFLEPHPQANHQAIMAIMEADWIVMAPGGWYTSMIPNFLVEGISQALKETRARVIHVVNLMNRRGQTTGFKVSDYHRDLVRIIGKDVFDYLLVNHQVPPKSLIEQYAEEGDLVINDMEEKRVVIAPLLGPIARREKDPLMKRNLIRHHSERVAREIVRIMHLPR